MNKRLLVSLPAVILCLLLSACGASGSVDGKNDTISSEEESCGSIDSNLEGKKTDVPDHKNQRTESQVIDSVHFIDETLDHHIYYAYHTSGEFMFSVRDDYAEETEYVETMNFYYGGLKLVYSIFKIADDAFDIVEQQWMLDSSRRLRTGRYYLSNLESTATLESEGFVETIYAEDGLSYKEGNVQYILNEEGKVLETIEDPREDGTQYGCTYSYDEYGNVSTLTIIDCFGKRTNSFEYEYNEYGQPLNCRVGNSLDSYEYFCLQDMTEQEKEFLDFLEPYAGYWIREDGEQTCFLGIAINMLCMGVIDEETGCAIVDQYAFYDVNEDGTLHCEFYRNGFQDNDVGSRDIELSLNNGKLIFEGTEYQLLW